MARDFCERCETYYDDDKYDSCPKCALLDGEQEEEEIHVESEPPGDASHIPSPRKPGSASGRNGEGKKTPRKKKKTSNMLPVLFVLLLVGLAGSGGYYYYFIYRPLHQVLPTYTVSTGESFNHHLNVPDITSLGLISDKPDWIDFDAQAFTLRGVPPDNESGMFHELLFATTTKNGKQGELTVKFFVKGEYAPVTLSLECKTARSGENIDFGDTGFATVELNKDDMLEIYVKDDKGNVLTQGVINMKFVE